MKVLCRIFKILLNTFLMGSWHYSKIPIIKFYWFICYMTETMCLSNLFIFLWIQKMVTVSQNSLPRSDTCNFFWCEFSRRNGNHFQVWIPEIFHNPLLYLSLTHMQLKAEFFEIVKTRGRRSSDLSSLREDTQMKYHQWALTEWATDAYYNTARFCY